jgi:hypothetical protein
MYFLLNIIKKIKGVFCKNEREERYSMLRKMYGKIS